MGAILKIINISKVFSRKVTSPLSFNFIYDIISKKRKKFIALNKINLEINQGEIFGLVGQNGAGKTTLMRIISQVIIPDSGKIYYKNKNIFNNLIAKRNIVPSEMAIFDLFDATMALKFYADIYGIRISIKRIQKYLKEVSLNDVSGLPIIKYSSGMIQKLKFAKIMMLNPDIILFDEPTNVLDAISAKMTRKLILGLKDKGKTILITTHNMREVDLLCDRVGIINNGKIVYQGSLNKIKEKTDSKDFEEAYIKKITQNE